MSGRDEEPIRDIPICPSCEEKPDLWLLYPTARQIGEFGWICLASDDFIRKKAGYTKLVMKKTFMGRYTTLDNIVCVVCSNSRNHRFHTFPSGHPVFSQVLKYARRINNERQRGRAI